MVKRMLVDANHPEEIRVVVLDGTRLDEFDLETSTKKQNKGNIYLAKVVRVEPSLQAAFVDYGGNRHGFLAFSEIHPDYYQIPVADREALLEEVNAHDELYAQEDPEDAESLPSGKPDTLETNSNAASDLEAGTPKVSANAPWPFTADTESISDTQETLDQENATESDQTDVSTPFQLSKTTPLEIPLADPKVISEKADDKEMPSLKASSEDTGSADNDEDIPADASTDDKSPPLKAGVEEVGGEDEAEENLDVHRRKFVSSRRYKIQEVIKRRQILLVQVVKEERGTKGAALTTYLSLAGRYCVLMPNSSRGGGVSRKITNNKDRRRLKSILTDLKISNQMAVILRTAGAERSKAEVKRDFEYLQRTWNHIREVTMESRAPDLIHEEANLIKRSIRDIYSRDIEEILVEGEQGYRAAKEFMKTLTPSHAKKVKRYKDETIPLLHRYQVESQLDAMHSPTVQLKSGGSIVFGQTEALVAIDVNSGRATKERHIEETALKTNIEAAEEIARQLRLRDLAGLVVIDFIDMDENRNNHAVERKLKEALKSDRARIQVGRISHFGLLELSRQRLRPSLIEANFEVCKSCTGTGLIRSIESTSFQTLRAIEEEGLRHRTRELTVHVHPDVALYLLNYKRSGLEEIQTRYGMQVFVLGDETLIPPDIKMERVKSDTGKSSAEHKKVKSKDDGASEDENLAEVIADEDAEGNRKRKRRRRRKRQADSDSPDAKSADRTDLDEDESSDSVQTKNDGDSEGESQKKGRRRGRRGGRRRKRDDRPQVDANDETSATPGSQAATDLQSSNSKPIHIEKAGNRDLGNAPKTAADPIPVQPVATLDSKPSTRLFEVIKRGADALLPGTSISNVATENSDHNSKYGSENRRSDVVGPKPKATAESEPTPPEVESQQSDISANKNKGNDNPTSDRPTNGLEETPRRGWWIRDDGTS